MLADDLENHFVRVFHARPMQWADEIYWDHGQIQYRLRYQLTSVRNIGSFVERCLLDVLGDKADRYVFLHSKDFLPESKVQDVAQWAAKIIIARDAY